MFLHPLLRNPEARENLAKMQTEHVIMMFYLAMLLNDANALPNNIQALIATEHPLAALFQPR